MTERIIRRVLQRAGITVNGNAPWDIKINDPRFYNRVLINGSLGLGESYMRGDWDCQRLDQFFHRLLRNGVPWVETINPVSLALFLKSRLLNLAPKGKAFEIGQRHYDLGNNLFQAMLDPTVSYSCGYWRNASSLEEAQIAKLDLICRKLHLQPGQRVLDIGCGFGGFARYAATHYSVEVVGLTVSREQAALAWRRCLGLSVVIRLEDYRDVCGQFDHVVSVGMFEHVESKNHRIYMQVVQRSLRPGGFVLLHTIGSSRGGTFNSPDPWIREYIFPLGQIPTRRQILRSSRGILEVRDWHEFGQYYDPTLMSWDSRFVAAWDELQAEYGDKVGGQFRRMWEYYLLSCAGAFRAGNIELWQVVLAHPGEHRNYYPVQ